MTERDAITYLRSLGYKVSKPRRTTRNAKKLIGEHLDGLHRGSYTDACRVCRFSAMARGHRSHSSEVDGCALCLDRRMLDEGAYLYSSRLVADWRPSSVAEVIAANVA